jgi:hypothetical protein
MNRHENIKNVNIFIKNKINEIYEKYNFDIFLVRKHIKNVVVNEAGKKIVYNSLTGINKLELLLKNILNQLETSYKSLTTDKTQRDSFKKHIINAVENLLDLKDKNFYASQNMNASLGLDSIQEKAQMEIVFDQSNFDEDGILKKDEVKQEKKSEEDKKKEFSIPGMDETGRDESFYIFDKISKQIEATYDVLRNKLDRTVFKTWLPKNLVSYMETWEEEMQKASDNVDV